MELQIRTAATMKTDVGYQAQEEQKGVLKCQYSLIWGRALYSK